MDITQTLNPRGGRGGFFFKQKQLLRYIGQNTLIHEADDKLGWKAWYNCPLNHD